MGPFKRSRPESSSESAADLRVRDAAYRRIGHALATVVVTLDSAPPAQVRLRIRSDGGEVTAEPMMITHEAPRTRAETHRLWFSAELSTVMFGDSELALIVGAAEVRVPEPAAFADWNPDHPDADPVVASEVLAESELRAAVGALEERCRALESARDELAADSRRMGEAVAATLAEVEREREQLLDLVARTTADRASDAGAPRRLSEEPGAGDVLYAPNHGFLARLSAARGAASD